MAVAILIFSAISALVGIWLEHWEEGRPTSIVEGNKLKRKRIISVATSVFLLVGLIMSYVQFKNDAKESNEKIARELENYKKIDTVKQVGTEAKKTIDTIKLESEKTLLKFDSLNVDIDKSRKTLSQIQQLSSRQSDLTKQQINFSKNVEYSNFLSNYMEYQILVHEYYKVAHYIYQSSFRKEDFLQLKRNQIEQLENDINQAINNIRKNKFVSTNNQIDARWIELQGQLFSDLYFFRYQIGDQFKDNDLLYIIDNSKRESCYDSLQNFLNENNQKRTVAIEKIRKETYIKYMTSANK